MARSWYARAGLILTPEIADQAVTTAKIAAGAVTEAELAAGAVTQSKLAALSVGTGKIIDGNVTAVKLASGAVRQSNMSTTTFSASGTISAAATNLSVLLNPYSFWPRLWGNTASNLWVSPNPTGGGDADSPRFQLIKTGGAAESYAIDCRSMNP